MHTQTATTTSLPVLLTMGEAATAARMAKRTIEYHVASGALPVIRVGRKVFIATGDLAEFLRSRRNPGKPNPAMLTPSAVQRTAAQRDIVAFIDALAHGDFAAADALIPATAANVVALEAAGLVIRALQLADDPEAAFHALREIVTRD